MGSCLLFFSISRGRTDRGQHGLNVRRSMLSMIIICFYSNHLRILFDLKYGFDRTHIFEWKLPTMVQKSQTNIHTVFSPEKYGFEDWYNCSLLLYWVSPRIIVPSNPFETERIPRPNLSFHE